MLINFMKTILFIEDESVLQKTFGDILRQEGYEMISALDGEIGLNVAKTKKPDLILLDLVLPKVYGIEVLRELKEDETTKEIPVIILTNLEKIGDIGKALELGATTATIIPADHVVIDERVRLKCVVPRCLRAGETPNCPPYAPDLNLVRQALSRFSKAVLIKCNVEPIEEKSNERWGKWWYSEVF